MGPLYAEPSPTRTLFPSQIRGGSVVVVVVAVVLAVDFRKRKAERDCTLVYNIY